MTLWSEQPSRSWGWHVLRVRGTYRVTRMKYVGRSPGGLKHHYRSVEFPNEKATIKHDHSFHETPLLACCKMAISVRGLIEWYVRQILRPGVPGAGEVTIKRIKALLDDFRDLCMLVEKCKQA